MQGKAAGCLGARSFLCIDGHLLTHGSENNNIGFLLLHLEEFRYFLANLALRDFDVVLGIAVITHQAKESIIGDVEKLVFLAKDVGNIHIVSGGAKLLQLLTSEDVNRDKVDLGMTMFPGLGGGHIDNFAGTILNNNETVLPQGRALHRVSSGCTRISGVERVLMLCIIRHLVTNQLDEVGG